MEEKLFYNSNDNKLCGMLTRASKDKIVIMCHGIRGNKDECGGFVQLVESIKNTGYSSFRFDFYGHGESGGQDKDMTISKEISDLENTVKMLQEKGYKEFVLVGGSFGAGIVSLFPFEKYECIKGIVLWYGALDYSYIKYGNLFTEENKNIAERDGFYVSRSMNSGEEFRFGLELFNEIDKYKPYEALENNNLPKLFIHGEIDSAVPYELSKKVSNNCRNARFILIQNGEHTFQNAKEAINTAVNETVVFINEIFNSSIVKRESVKKDYDIIADQYAAEFGRKYEDMEVVSEFMSMLKPGDSILDLGGGTGKYTDLLIKNGFKSKCYDFSKEMMRKSKEFYGDIPYILDDMLNIKNHYNEESLDGIIAFYSLFHIPREDIMNLFSDMKDVLKVNGLLCFCVQLGDGEGYIDEPYLNEEGKGVLYFNGFTEEFINELLDKNNFEMLYESRKQEVGDNELGNDSNTKIFMIAKKIK